MAYRSPSRPVGARSGFEPSSELLLGVPREFQPVISEFSTLGTDDCGRGFKKGIGDKWFAADVKPVSGGPVALSRKCGVRVEWPRRASPREVLAETFRLSRHRVIEHRRQRIAARLSRPRAPGL